MPGFVPRLSVLPPPQRRLWPELAAAPGSFTLYGGTALALRFGHRSSVDFDFFSDHPFDPDALAASMPFLRDAERVQVAPNTLTCRVERGGPVLVSFFGDLGLGRVRAREPIEGTELCAASLLDLAGTKVAMVQRRAESRDYIDIDALLAHGIDLPTALSCGRIVYGRAFNPIVMLKALTYFAEVPDLPAPVRRRLAAAAAAVDPCRLPEIAPDTPHRSDRERPA